MKDTEPAKVAENDLRKLHSEVTQIVSQRFNLTTIAVLAFAAICGWATSAIGRDKPITPDFVALVALLVLVVLAALFVYFTLLLGMMRIFTVYMTEKYESPWETDWKEYRTLPNSRTYWGYSKAGTFVFQILGALSIIFPGALLIVGGSPLNPFPLVLLLPIGAFLIYEVSIHFVTKWRDKIIDEASISRNWKEVVRHAAHGKNDDSA
jgi:hypothetical protein